MGAEGFEEFASDLLQARLGPLCELHIIRARPLTRPIVPFLFHPTMCSVVRRSLGEWRVRAIELACIIKVGGNERWILWVQKAAPVEI
jgi:hypothetical protein